MSFNTIIIRRRALAGLIALTSAAGSAYAQDVDRGPIVNPASGNVYYRLTRSSVGDARDFAAGLGGRLVTINTATENQWLWDTFLAGGARSLLIGLSDEAAEGTFVWDSGQDVAFTRWAVSEPNDGNGGQDFTVIRPGRPEWHDQDVDELDGAIVEIDGSDCMNAVPIQMAATTLGTLGETDAIDTACSDARNRTWFTFVGNEAPVSVNTCAGSNFDTLIEVFIGTCGSLECVGANDDAECGFEGDLGSSLTFFAFAGQTYYVAVSDFTGGAGEQHTFSITLEPGELDSPELLGAPIYNPINGHSYVLQGYAIPFVAMQGAARYNAFLTTVDDAAENVFVATRLGGPHQFVFIGYSDSSTEGAFTWMDSSTSDYTNWAPGEPNNFENEDYTMVQPEGTWVDVPSSFVAQSVIELDGDSCSQAVPMTIPSTLVGGYAFATQGPGEDPCADFPLVHGRGVWYRLIGNGESVTVSTCDPRTNFDTTLRVFSGACGAMRCVSANDDDHSCHASGLPAPYLRSTTTFYTERGVDYFVLLSKSHDQPPLVTDEFALTVSSAVAAPLAVLARSDINPQTCSRYLLTDRANAPRHFDEALNLGGDMGAISNPDENESARAFIQSTGVAGAFIGLTDRAVEGAFAWLDGSAPTFTDWMAGEPSNEYGDEDYVLLYAIGEWNDVSEVHRDYGVVNVRVNAVPGGRIRGGLLFSGDESHVDMPANAIPWMSGAYTVECWIRATGSGIILGQAGSDEGSYVPMLYVGTNGILYAADWVGSVDGSLLIGPQVDNAEWTHVAFVRSGNARTLYVNGVAVNSELSIFPHGYGNGNYFYSIGHGEWTNWEATGPRPSFNGEIDEFRVWSSARTAADIRATRDTRYFNPSLYPDLVLAYDMDDAGGALVFDPKAGKNGRADPSAWPLTWTYENRNGNKVLDACEVVCPADIDGNGVVNSTDVSQFINLWFADQADSTFNADFNRNGISNSTDVSDMINAYFNTTVGCM